MEQRTGAYGGFDGQNSEKETTWKHGRGWEVNIKTDLQEIKRGFGLDCSGAE
jgi:hypothetical protein